MEGKGQRNNKYLYREPDIHIMLWDRKMIGAFVVCLVDITS
jgi:hypothetical protein